ncbi:hypothetical protein T265_07783 [Opisthorchis viverrini]|uniref:Uncharacterized protein n=1 Tax=Opisthorchis viverrini TaxID=6198 RepID=A0A074ZBR8_OPIVI|nr:hypothetical protein T265_07783 [Opisthorchis viverrini]KER24588.1 hypothetical protein T265_07783 [Opisthorchis viverrini]
MKCLNTYHYRSCFCEMPDHSSPLTRANSEGPGSNPTSASQLLQSRLGQPGSIPALVLPSGGMAARQRKGVAAERLFHYYFYLTFFSFGEYACTNILNTICRAIRQWFHAIFSCYSLICRS